MSRKARFSLPARLASFGAAIVAASLLALDPAAAESIFCERIQADYISADRAAGGGGGGDVAQLRREYAKVQGEARRLGCQRFLFFGPRPSKQCPQVMGRLNQLQRDLNRAGGGSFGFGRNQAARQRDYLRQALVENGCEIPATDAFGFFGSGYRTLCVRTCDGYYFPISYSVGRGRFKIDEAVCKAMYGGADAALYVHGNGGTADQAVSLAGKPLALEPFAFQARTAFNAACQAELHAGLGAIAAAAVARAAQLEKTEKATPLPKRPVPVPVARIPVSEDPETLANLEGNFRIETPDSPEQEADTVADASAHIRKLGPEYYYLQPAKIENLGKRPPKAGGFGLVDPAYADEKDAAPDEEPPPAAPAPMVQ